MWFVIWFFGSLLIGCGLAGLSKRPEVEKTLIDQDLNYFNSELANMTSNSNYTSVED